MSQGTSSEATPYRRKTSLDFGSVAILVASLCCQISYLGYTTFTERTADAGEHLRYVLMLRDQHELPTVVACEVCHHPPLYYIVAALVSWVGVQAHVQDEALLLQRLSLVFSAVYLVFGALTIRLFIQEKITRWLGTALIAFWPSAILASCRIHNDSLANALIVAAAYFLMAFLQDKKERQYVWGTVLVGLALLTKSTGLIALALWGAVTLRRMAMTTHRVAELRRLVFPSLALTGLFALRSAFKPKIEGASLCFQHLGRACLGAGNRLEQDWTSFLWPNVSAFVHHPFLQVGPKGPEKGYFWNCLLKSSLFGMFHGAPDEEMSTGLGTPIALIANYLLLALLAYALVLGLLEGRDWYRKHAALLFLCAASVGFLMVFRLVIPNPYHSDFRHILGASIWGAVLLLSLIERQRARNTRLYWLGLGLCLGMNVDSLAFFVPKTNQETQASVTLPNDQNRPRAALACRSPVQ